MYWLRTPQKVYFKKGCMFLALDELKTEYGCKRVLIVTDTGLYKNFAVNAVEKKLSALGIMHSCYFALGNKVDLSAVKDGAKAASLFEPDAIVAVGGKGVISASKLIRVLYACPEADIARLSESFGDITSRDTVFPQMQKKILLVAIPTNSGSGCEMSPFAVVNDGEDKYQIADYSIMPDVAVIDADFSMNSSQTETASCAAMILSHALESYFSDRATTYTDGFAIKAIALVMQYLPSAYENGSGDPVAREKLAEASAMSGIAFANAGNLHGVSFESACSFCAVRGFISAMRDVKGADLDRVQELNIVLGTDNAADKLEALLNACRDE